MMKKMIQRGLSVVIGLGLCALPVQAQTIAHVEYSGGQPQFSTQPLAGHLELKEVGIEFYGPNEQSFKIPYQEIRAAQYHGSTETTKLTLLPLALFTKKGLKLKNKGLYKYSIDYTPENKENYTVVFTLIDLPSVEILHHKIEDNLKAHPLAE